MGGLMSVNDDLFWLCDELVLLCCFIEWCILLIGYCFGGQLLVCVLGVMVWYQFYIEMGWQFMQWESCDSLWLVGLLECFLIFQWYGDVFDLLQGVECLLFSLWCENQGFFWGGYVFGL